MGQPSPSQKDIGIVSSSEERRWHTVIVWLWGFPGTLLILLVRGYQLFIGPLLGKHCRFHPSCSNYFIQAVQKYGAIVGAWKGICRIGRCHPWHPGGYDPP